MDLNQVLKASHKFTMVTFIISYKCPLQCPMCFFSCSPSREEYLPKEDAFKVLVEAKELGIPVLGIAGGEPFLQMAYLQELVHKATTSGMTAIIVTNAYWAASEEKAFHTLYDLNKLGLKRIQISLDDQHQQFIPIQNVANAISAAQRLNFENIMLLGTSKGNSEKFKIQLFYLQEFLNVDIDRISLIDRPRSSHKYFADAEQIRYPFNDLENALTLNLPVKRPSDCLTELMVDVNGDVYPCCNNFVGKIGNIHNESLKRILENLSINDWFKIMKEYSPFEAARRIDDAFGTDFRTRKYSNWCELCARIFQNENFQNLLCTKTCAC